MLELRIGNPELERRILVAFTSAKAAGAAMADRFKEMPPETFAIDPAADLVTGVDRLCEQMILAEIRRNFAQDSILSEGTGLCKGESRFVWIIDPLDGTSNYSMGIPYFGVCISVQQDDCIEFACVYNPITEEMAYAAGCSGAYVNGQRVTINSPVLRENLVGFLVNGYGTPKHAYVVTYRELLSISKRVLNTWAPSLDWITLLKGGANYLVTYRTEVEDFCAGAYIYRQAGGEVRTWEGYPCIFNAASDRITSVAASANTIDCVQQVLSTLGLPSNP
jgi:myo-inositol-1(or 4)-monophosphatase